MITEVFEDGICLFGDWLTDAVRRGIADRLTGSGGCFPPPLGF